MNDEERKRLAALKSLSLVDTPSERELDELAKLAATICETPIGLVTLIDEHRQWFKAAFGVWIGETPQEIPFCGHAIQQRGLLVVEDATQDERFAGNPLVTGQPHLKFYAGVPVHTPDGMAVGTLCVIDYVARSLSDSQRAALEVLAEQVSARLELRLHRTALEEATRARTEMSAGLKASEECFRAFMDNSPFVSYIKDLDGRYLFYNKQAATSFGVNATELLGRRDEDFWSKAISDRVRKQEQAVLAARKPIETTEQVIGKDGRQRCWRTIRFLSVDGAGTEVLGSVAVDETENRDRKLELEAYQAMLEEANNRLRNAAVTDVLTGLRNRRAFEERLSIEFSIARRRRRALSVALMDADNFKLINDQFGHAAGDQVLRKLGQMLEATVRVSDLAVRYGGEEFAILLPETDANNARLWANRLLAAIHETTWENGVVTVSVGLATLTPNTPDGAQLVLMADRALYAAKRAGKNQVLAFEESNGGNHPNF